MTFSRLRHRQHGYHFPDISKCIFVNKNVLISIKFSLNIVPDGSVNNIPALVQIMAWRRLDDKLLTEPMMVLLLTHICVTRPQCVNVLCVPNRYVNLPVVQDINAALSNCDSAYTINKCNWHNCNGRIHIVICISITTPVIIKKVGIQITVTIYMPLHAQR